MTRINMGTKIYIRHHTLAVFNLIKYNEILLQRKCSVSKFKTIIK